MKKRAKQYSLEFVRRAVQLGVDSDRPLSEVARDLSVEYATLYGWMKKAGKTNKRQVVAPSVPQTDAAMQAELERLRRELEEVKKERDFLKKAAAFFAQQNK
jgi:transposase